MLSAPDPLLDHLEVQTRFLGVQILILVLQPALAIIFRVGDRAEAAIRELLDLPQGLSHPDVLDLALVPLHEVVLRVSEGSILVH